MYIAGIVVVIIFVNLDASTAAPNPKGVKLLPSLCCITGDKRNYVINTTFLTDDCKEKCVCTQDAFLACIPLCPQPIRNCPGHMVRQKVREPFTIKKQTCYCTKYECVSPPGQGSMAYTCTDGGKQYKEGETFVRNCNEKCRCQMSGRVDCVSLCPKSKSCSKVAYTEKDVSIPIPYTNNKCQCSAKSCKPKPYNGDCKVNGKTYKNGDTFATADCSSSCTCQHGNMMCTNLCPPQVQNCKADEKPVVTVQNKIPNTTCSCPSYKCVKSGIISVTGQIVNKNTKINKPPTNQNQHQCTTTGGKVYPVGSVFTDNNCKSQCFCNYGQNNGPAAITCHALCAALPPPDSSCKNPKIVDVPSNLPDAQGKTCSCPVQQCN